MRAPEDCLDEGSGEEDVVSKAFTFHTAQNASAAYSSLFLMQCQLRLRFDRQVAGWPALDLTR